MSLTELVEREVQGNTFNILSINAQHLDELAKLPFEHKDPFDRLIVSQSLAEDMATVSKNQVFQCYLVQLVW